METLEKYRGLFLFEGIAFVILGALAIAMPGLSTLSVELLIGWLLLVGGVIQAVRTFQLREGKEIVWSILSTIVYLAAGVLLLLYPLKGVLTLTLLLAAFFTAEGIVKIFYSLTMRQFANWGWILVSGILSLILAAIIWSGWPGTAAWVLGLLVGINLLFLGFTMISLYMGMPKGES